MTLDEQALHQRAEQFAETTATTSLAVMAGDRLIVDVRRPLAASGGFDVFSGSAVLEPDPPPALGLAFELLPDDRMRQDIASAHKSVVAMLIGAARDRELLDLDDPVTTHLGPGWSRAPADVEQTITLHHLLTMTSGLDDTLEIEAAPGTVWNYTLGPAWHMLKRVLPAAAGMSLEALSAEWLFDPLGLTDTVWARRPGMTYLDGEPFEVLLTHAAELALLGHLVLRGGRAGDRQVLSSEFVTTMTTRSQDLNHAYGLLWWLNAPSGVRLPLATETSEGKLAPDAPADTVAMLGAMGQICLVVPSRDLVVTRIGGLTGGRDAYIGLTLMNQLWREVVEGS